MSRTDDFQGDNAHLVECINALLDMDDAKALVPHGLGKGSHAYRLLNAAAHRIATASARITGGDKDRENLVARPSVVPDEVVEALVAEFRRLPLHGDAGCDKLTDDEWRTVARTALTASLPAIKAQVLAEIVAWLRMGEHVHSRSGSIESERVFKLIADAIERGEHEND